MITKKDLIGNSLIKEIVSIRVDTLWKMLALKKEGLFPKVNEEGATGEFDNKGAIFVPGGLIFEDSDRNPINKKHFKELTSKEFREQIKDSMRYDNATLLYHDGIATGVNLDNGFFAEVSGRILANKQAAMKRNPVLRDEPPVKMSSRDITKSHCPTYIKPPYGSRTKLSTCIAVCLMEPRMYYVQCRTEFGLRGGDEEKEVWDNIRSSRKPIIGKDGTVLAPPYVVVCHTTRYRESIFSGITRILGIGKFGEFATVTLEEATNDLLNEISAEKTEINPNDIFAEYDGIKAVGVLRIYSKTSPGKRLLGATTLLISPKKDLGLDLDKITQEAKARYNIK